MLPLRNLATLPAILRLDAAASGLMGLALVAVGARVAPLLGLDATLLRAAGGALLPFAAGVWWLAGRTPVPPGGVRAVIATNAAWLLGSVVVFEQPTIMAWGMLVVGAQALAVAAFTALQARGLRRPRAVRVGG